MLYYFEYCVTNFKKSSQLWMLMWLFISSLSFLGNHIFYRIAVLTGLFISLIFLSITGLSMFKKISKDLDE